MTGTTATKIGGGVTAIGGPRMVQRPLLGRPPGQNSVTSVQKLPHGLSPTGRSVKVASMNSPPTPPCACRDSLQPLKDSVPRGILSV